MRKVPVEDLASRSAGESSASIRKRVIKARNIQTRRFSKTSHIYSNAQMSPKMVRTLCRPDKAGKTLLKKAISTLGLSARAYDRILKVSRTVADLDGSEQIKSQHVAEAVQYRSLDREGWLG